MRAAGGAAVSSAALSGGDDVDNGAADAETAAAGAAASTGGSDDAVVAVAVSVALVAAERREAVAAAVPSVAAAAAFGDDDDDDEDSSSASLILRHAALSSSQRPLSKNRMSSCESCCRKLLKRGADAPIFLWRSSGITTPFLPPLPVLSPSPACCAALCMLMTNRLKALDRGPLCSASGPSMYCRRRERAQSRTWRAAFM